MQDTLKKLEELQEVDLQIDSLMKKKNELPQALQAYEKETQTLTLKLNEQRKIVEEIERNRNQQLGALELNEERLKRSQEKSDKVKTNQELQALTKEVESLKKSSAVIGENEKKIAEELRAKRAILEETEKTIAEINSKMQEERSKISQGEGVIGGDLEKIKSKRSEIAKGVQARLLAAYDRIRSGRQGIGVAIATGGNCKACNMKIPPQVYNELQRGTEMQMCPSCNRILIYRDSNQKSSAIDSSSVQKTLA